MRALILLLISLLFGGFPQSQAMPESDGLSFWNENGIRIFMSDNGTPGNYEDDWVVDWEDNRDVEVFVFD